MKFVINAYAKWSLDIVDNIAVFDNDRFIIEIESLEKLLDLLNIFKLQYDPFGFGIIISKYKDDDDIQYAIEIYESYRE